MSIGAEVIWRVGLVGISRGGRWLSSEVDVGADDWAQLEREVGAAVSRWFRTATGDAREPMEYAWATTVVPISGGLAAMFQPVADPFDLYGEPVREASDACRSRVRALVGEPAR